MSYLSLLLSLQHAFIHAVFLSRSPALSHHVELVDVYIISLKIIKGCIQILPKILRLLCRSLCGDHYILTPDISVSESSPYFYLTVTVCPGRIKKAHPALIGIPQYINSLFNGHSLYG